MLSSLFAMGLLLLAPAIAAPLIADDTSSSSSFCVIQPATPLQQKARFEAFVQKLFVEKNIEEAYHTYVVENLVEHDATTGNGAQTSIDALKKILPTATLTIYHQTFEFVNSTGWVHTRASGNSFFGNETALADLYRFNGSCIVEHWDVVQMRPANATNNLF